MKLSSCKLSSRQLHGWLLRGASVGALAALVVAPALAQSSDALETVVVTGSRVISSAAKSPTPLTVVNIEDLQLTAPSSIPDGLNKLPVFQGSSQPRTAGAGSYAGGLNVLNLRNFGVQRTLVLLDGHRAPPSSADGTVDIDTLPQMLMAHVDVVTGGASAVYGSDAVTGVVNFVLDKKFTGFKVDANAGISTYADGASYNLGLAAGIDVFGGHGHVEGAVRHFQQDGVRLFDRPYGPQVWMLTGSGSAASPFTFSENIGRADYAWGGKITCSSCTANGEQFSAAGAITPFVLGTTTGTGNQNSGGDGAASKYGSASTNVRTNESFGRFSYDLDSSTTFYVQAIAAEQFASGWWFPTKLSHDVTATFYKNNAFLTAAEQTQLGNNGLNNSTNTFAVGEYFDLGPEKLVGSRTANRNLSLTTGLDGTLFGDFTWDLFYTHGENRQAVDVVNNTNYQKQYAALDAVMGSSGSVQCYAATTAAYSNCVPMDPFGPGLMSTAAYNYITATTWYHQTNILDNVGGSVAGTAFDDWAGPVKVAVTAEARFNDYTVDSNASPTATVDCTGLRLCNSGTVLWAQNVVAAVHASNNVWEFAGEADIPLLKDLPFVQSLNANVAGRYTDYSTSGSVQTWKIGVDYHVNDQVRFRGTTSVDIRAPTLNDLFSPVQKTTTSFNDNHLATPLSGSTMLASQGNSALVPEVARTYTVGVVLSPEFIPGLVASLDYYNIKLKNAISTIDGRTNDIQALCNSSGGSSPFCSLYVRPLGFGNTTAANYATTVYKEVLNAAMSEIEGFDFETNYTFQMADLIDQAKGSWNVRLLANYQPVDQSQAYPGAPITYFGPSNGLNDLQTWKVSKTHLTAFLRYNLGDWSFVVQDRWHGGFSTKTSNIAASQNWVTPHIRSVNYVDGTISRDFSAAGGDFTSYLSVQNVFNSRSAVYANSGSVSLYYPVTPEEDIMGRYFTIGIRAKF
ncbi:MAG: TonB-dependent receptor [Rhizomicrobium sp.]|nr:TonB-dependent receptor [Rhizomicrobium sp.]